MADRMTPHQRAAYDRARVVPDDTFLQEKDLQGPMPMPRNYLADLAREYGMPSISDRLNSPTSGIGMLVDAVGGLGNALVVQPAQSFNRLLQQGYEPGNPQSAEDAFNVAGAAMVGGLAAPKPSNTVGIFGGRLAKTADHAKLAQAERMAAEGAPREQIWNETGWFKAPDGKWKWEIDDSGMQPVRGTFLDALERGGTRSLGIHIDHPELFNAYPGTSSMPVTTTSGVGASYSKGEIKASSPRPDILLHEAQHHLQAKEGFSRGGPSWEKDYRRLAGEVEARAVEKRMNLTPEERAARPPWLDYDVPEGQQIVRFSNDGTSQSIGMSGKLEGAATNALAERPGIRAYHGSPHDFDKFDMSKIGTGEGAQAYGHGLYFAENEGVARWYRDVLGKDFQFNGTSIPTNTFAAGDGYGSLSTAQQFAVDYKGNIGAAIKAASELRDAKIKNPDDPWLKRYASGELDNVIAELKQAKASADPEGFLRKQGKMYEVRINASPDDFLDWDKPLSQQSEKVRGALAPVEDVAKQSFLYEPDSIPHLMSAFRNAKKSANIPRPPDSYPEQALREAGIPGIKYLDQGSRSQGEGSRNYVVFDDALVEILRKYGLLGMIGGGAAAASSQSDSKKPTDWARKMQPGDA